MNPEYVLGIIKMVLIDMLVLISVYGLRLEKTRPAELTFEEEK